MGSAQITLKHKVTIGLSLSSTSCLCLPRGGLIRDLLSFFFWKPQSFQQQGKKNQFSFYTWKSPLISISVGPLGEIEVQINGTKEGIELLTVLLRMFSYKPIYRWFQIKVCPKESRSRETGLIFQQTPWQWPYTKHIRLGLNLVSNLKPHFISALSLHGS